MQGPVRDILIDPQYLDVTLPARSEFTHSTKRGHTVFAYIIEGKGTWYIEDIPHEVCAGDVVIVPPNTRFYYKGSLKQICITSPAWEPEFEHHVRDIE